MIVPITKIKPNPKNPRIIKDVKFNKLVNSIKEFPEMLELRPIVVDEDMVVLGGNMRLKACIAAGLKEVPITIADKLTEEQKAEFIIKDNASFGEWDWDVLANEWEVENLTDWGLDVPFEQDEKQEENPYSKKIDAPTYEPSEEKPSHSSLVDMTKTLELIKEIEASPLNKEDKQFLSLAAQRHLVFDYSKIADFYANSDKTIQDLMEKSALVIIDFDKAIELGYVKFNEELAQQYDEEYE